MDRFGVVILVRFDAKKWVELQGASSFNEMVLFYLFDQPIPNEREASRA